MKGIRGLTVFLVVALLLPAFVGPVTAQNTLPPESGVRTYVEALVSQYNSLLPSDKVYTIDSMESSFPLYQAPNTSFQVIVVQSIPNETGWIALVFTRIYGSNISIIMDGQDTFQSMNRNLVALAGGFVYANNTVYYNGVPTHFQIAIGLPLENITTYPVTNAYAEAGDVYASLSSMVHLVKQPVTTVTTVTNTVTTNLPPKHIFGIAVNDPQNQTFVIVVDFFIFTFYVLLLIRPRLRKRYRSEGKNLIDLVIGIVAFVALGGLLDSFPYDYQLASLQSVAIGGWVVLLALVYLLWKRATRPVQRRPNYGARSGSKGETKEGGKTKSPEKEKRDKGKDAESNGPEESAKP